MSTDLRTLSTRTSVEVLVAFADITRFQVSSRSKTETEIADSLDALYRLVEERIDSAGGLVVKFIGDAALIVFDADHVDAGVRALYALKNEIDAWLPEHGWPKSRAVLKVHYGEVVAGPFGHAGRFDVLGNTVNTAATLESRDLAISPQVFRKLDPETRTLFKKHTPPVTYIRVEDRH